jgi:hypothetical protein
MRKLQRQSDREMQAAVRPAQIIIGGGEACGRGHSSLAVWLEKVTFSVPSAQGLSLNTCDA